MVWLYFSELGLFLFTSWFFSFLSYRPSFSPSSFLHQHRSSSFWLWRSVRPAGGSTALLTVWWMTSLRRGLWVENMGIVWEKYLNMELRETETNGGRRWRESFTDAPLKTEELCFFVRTVLLRHVKAELTDYWSDHLSVFLSELWQKKLSLNVLLLLAVGGQSQQIHNRKWEVEDVRPESLHSYWTEWNSEKWNKPKITKYLMFSDGRMFLFRILFWQKQQTTERK